MAKPCRGKDAVHYHNYRKFGAHFQNLTPMKLIQYVFIVIIWLQAVEHSAPVMANSRPNVIVIYTDDQVLAMQLLNPVPFRTPT